MRPVSTFRTFPRRRHLAVFLLFALAGCSSEYNIVLLNRTSERVYEAHVAYDDFESVGGLIGAGGGAAHNLPHVPIPKTAAVSWRSENGTKNSRTVEVRAHLPRSFRKGGDLIFTIRSDGEVDFLAETWAEQDAREAARKRENPPVFEEGELAITSDSLESNSYTEGLSNWNHPELEIANDVPKKTDLIVALATRIKTHAVRYSPGDRIEIEDQTVCFGESGEDRLLVELCPAPEPSP